MKKLSETLKADCKSRDDFWSKREYDAKGNVTYYEDSAGCWIKREYDVIGNVTYYEDSNGVKRGTPKYQSCDGKSSQ